MNDDALEHWINNPLIKPYIKVEMFEEVIAKERLDAAYQSENATEERIIAIIESMQIGIYHGGHLVATGDDLVRIIRGEEK